TRARRDEPRAACSAGARGRAARGAGGRGRGGRHARPRGYADEAPAGRRLAGRTDYCEVPAAAKSKPSVGGMVNPNLESLVALKPDLVIATDEGNREETFQQLARLRIPTYLVHATRLSALLDMIARLGALTGREAAGGPLTEGLT